MVYRALNFVLVMSLAGCSSSVSIDRLNPFSSSDELGRSEIDIPDTGPEIRRDLVAEVTSVEVGTATGGILVQARGIAPLLGYYEGRLRLVQGQVLSPDGLIQVEFVARAPEAAPVTSGSPEARAITAAQFIDADTLGTATGVRVIAANGAVDHLF